MMNPLGKYGNVVAAFLAVIVVLAWLFTIVMNEPNENLDGVAKLVLGVVLGAQVVQNGTQTKATQALAMASNAQKRLDAVRAPTVPSPPDVSSER